MASTNLKLIIQKGPRNGETLEFTSRSTIRIGRVVKGNNLPIKDSGISSKHLQIKFDSESLSWVITDLDSSNGTIVNTSQLKPLFQSEIHHGDEIKIGELTAIRVEIVELKEETKNRRNPRRKVALKSDIDLRGKVVEGLNLAKNVEIREEIDRHKNPRRRAASKISTDLQVKVEGHDLGNKVEVPEEVCLNLEEENMEKRIKGHGRGGGRGGPKKIIGLDDGNIGGVCENMGNVEMKSECGVSTRRTRSSKRVEDGFVSENIVESTYLDPYKCEDVESIIVVDNKKTRRGCGKKKVVAESLENVADAVIGEKLNQEVLGKEHSEKVLDLREQPCDEQQLDDAQEQSVDDDKKNGQLMELEIPEQEGENQCAELLDEANQEQDCVSLLVSEQHFTNLMGVTNMQDSCVSLTTGDQCCLELIDEPTQREDRVVGPSPVEQGACGGVEIIDGRTEELAIEEIDKESEANCDGKSKDPETADVADLENMTLLDWFNFLETYFPKQIHAATDEIIEDMKKRSKHFDEYMSQHQKENSKLR
ncbi:hypothetical protein RDABS01_014015 [Bienertia sinuspersici]